MRTNKKEGKQAPEGEMYYLVHEDILPEAVVKTMRAKELISKGEAKTIHEAVERVGLSRSAFYKYKDGIHPVHKLIRERIITISLDLEHRSGMLSKVLSMIANHQGNVLTIHQTIPLQGLASVLLSVETSQMGEKENMLLHHLQKQEGVKRVAVIGQGGSV